MEKFICLLVFGVMLPSFLATVFLLAAIKVGSDADRDAQKVMKKHMEETARSPNRPRKFYTIEEQDDGTVDVYLCPDLVVYDTELGIREYDIDLRVIHGIVPWDGLDEDIRTRFSAWRESAARINI